MACIKMQLTFITSLTRHGFMYIYILHPAQRPQSECLTDGYAGGTGMRTGVVERDREGEVGVGGNGIMLLRSI